MNFDKDYLFSSQAYERKSRSLIKPNWLWVQFFGLNTFSGTESFVLQYKFSLFLKMIISYNFLYLQRNQFGIQAMCAMTEDCWRSECSIIT